MAIVRFPQRASPPSRGVSWHACDGLSVFKEAEYESGLMRLGADLASGADGASTVNCRKTDARSRVFASCSRGGVRTARRGLRSAVLTVAAGESGHRCGWNGGRESARRARCVDRARRPLAGGLATLLTLLPAVAQDAPRRVDAGDGLVVLVAEGRDLMALPRTAPRHRCRRRCRHSAG